MMHDLRRHSALLTVACVALGLIIAYAVVDGFSGRHAKPVEGILFDDIHFAVVRGDVAAVKALLENGADVNARDSEGRTPLHRTTKADIASVLVSKGADVNARYRSGRTPLHVAVLAMVPFLLARGTDVNAKDECCQTPLHLAAKWGHKENAKLLIASGAAIDARDRWAWTPLHIACAEGDVEMASLLLAHKANVKIGNDNGETPLHLAACDSIVRMLIEHGADIEARDSYRRSPLYDAVRSSNPDTVDMLVTMGADVNARNKSGVTPLHVAKFVKRPHGSLEKDRIERLLLESGADESATDNRGRVPAYWDHPRDWRDPLE